MTKILYRGRRGNKEWVFGNLRDRKMFGDTLIGDLFSNMNWQVQKDTIGQYTGLDDKNGVKIFEGDIVKVYKGYNHYPVSYQRGAFYVGKDMIASFADSNMEVIGNIHDNPELLEGKWSEDGECEKCATDPYREMTLEELEFALPLAVQKTERRQMPCPQCQIERHETVTYRQEIYRSDSFGKEDEKRRIYEISFRDTDGSYGRLFRSGRHYSFREALIKAHKYLDENGLKKREEEK